MSDYGHDLVFGAMLQPPAESGPEAVIAMAELMERAGFDLVSLSDHPYWPERYDTMMLLAHLAARTERVRLAVNVANLPMRGPVILGRQAATLDRLSGGRFELGLGTGAQQLWAEITANGGPRWDGPESVEALTEAVQIIRELWIPGHEVRFAGRHYQVDGARTGAGATHPIDVWFGAYQPRMLRLTGAYADAWIPSSPSLGPDRLAAANAIIDAAAITANRNPADVRRIYNIAGQFQASGTGFLLGPPQQWIDELTGLALTEGISGFLLYRVADEDLLRRFAAEVAPAVREAVAKDRNRRPIQTVRLSDRSAHASGRGR